MSQTDARQARIRDLLETDRIWSAYALADLYPPYQADSTWLLAASSVVLVYAGLNPPVLFGHGQPRELARLFSRIPAGEYQYTLMGSHRALLRQRLRPRTESRMWRMVLKPGAFEAPQRLDVERLTHEDLDQIAGLMDGHADRPDSFSPDQLQPGFFYGLRLQGSLVAMAGTHVVSESASVAAIGNVFTHPRHRGRGYGRRTSAAVVQALGQRGIQTIVLNVAMENEAALRLYRRLGFHPFCGYYEGVARLAETNTPSTE